MAEEKAANSEETSQERGTSLFAGLGRQTAPAFAEVRSRPLCSRQARSFPSKAEDI